MARHRPRCGRCARTAGSGRDLNLTAQMARARALTSRKVLALSRRSWENRGVSRVLDREGAHLAALRRLADLRGRRVLELGCGDGRLTVGLAADAESVFAFDPDGEAVERARRSLPSEFADRVAYRVAAGNVIELEAASFDLVVFSWSL